MSSDRKPSLILPVAVVGLLLAGYVGAYYWRVRVYDPSPYPKRAVYTNADPIFSESGAAMNRRLRPFFAPIHWLDRRIRPHVWAPT